MLPDGVANELVSEVQSSTNNQRPRHTEINVEGRVCESDKYEGVEVSLQGQVVKIRPVIERIAELEDWKVETLNMVPDADRTDCPHCEEEIFDKSISMFCAYVGEKPHSSAASLSDVFA